MIDSKLLPTRAMIDTNVFMRGLLGCYPEDPRAKQSIAFCDAMLKDGRKLLVAAPTLAELTRHEGKRIPRVLGVEVVPFDDRAAELLGLNLPMAKLCHTKSEAGLPLTYLKYDSMIFACAMRGRVEVLVTLDPDHHVLAKHTNISVKQPHEFEAAQTSLFDVFNP